MESIKIIINKIKDGSIKEMWNEFKWMMSYANNYKKEIIFYIFLGMFSTVMTLASSVASKELIDVVTGHNVSKAPLMAVVMISMALTLLNAPVMLVASKIMMSKMRKYNMKVKEMNSEVMHFQSETFSNVDSIKSFDLTDLFSRRLRNFQNRYKDVNLEYNLFSIKTNIVLSLIGMVIQNLLFVWAVYRLWTGHITYGEMTLFMTQSGRMSSAFNSLVSIVPSTVNSTISAARLIELVTLPKEDHAEDDGENLKDSVADGFSVKLKVYLIFSLFIDIVFF